MTLRFAGDELDPGEISAVLPVAPTRAHRKGEEFFAGSHAGKLRGRAMVGRGDKGVIITTGTFTADAKREATRDGAPAIDLIDGELLCDLLKDLKLAVRTEMVEQVTVESNWFADL